MPRPYTLAIVVPYVATNAGAEVNVSHLTDKVVQLHTYGSGTYQVQVSMDGTNWTNYGAAFTATGTLAIDFYCQYVRLYCSVNGAACTAVVAGVQQQD